MGFIFAARRAGYQPKTMPISAETPNASTIEENVTAGERSPVREMRNDTSHPRMIPITPPVTVRASASG